MTIKDFKQVYAHNNETIVIIHRFNDMYYGTESKLIDISDDNEIIQLYCDNVVGFELLGPEQK